MPTLRVHCEADAAGATFEEAFADCYSIELSIGPLKVELCTGRHLPRGVLGEATNVLLVCAASGLCKWKRAHPFACKILRR